MYTHIHTYVYIHTSFIIQVRWAAASWTPPSRSPSTRSPPAAREHWPPGVADMFDRFIIAIIKLYWL